MTASYVSARFEKLDLTSSIGSVRCIVRNLDDGPVPPPPNPGYFPTSPDALRDFLVIEYINDTIGERLVRVATLADLMTYSPRQLIGFEAPVDFVTAGVSGGDVLSITLPDNSEWVSEEYPASPFYFGISNVASPTQLELNTPIPSFKTAVSWEVIGKISGSLNGKTRRETFLVPGTTFLDRRMNLLFPDVPTMDIFVAATKATMQALGTTSTSSTLTSENYSTSG